jgi:hypothetical protein
VGLAETQRSVIGRELAGEPWGTVWIYCSYPVVAAGLRSIFEKRTRVHVGLAPRRRVPFLPPPSSMPTASRSGGEHSAYPGVTRKSRSWSPACTWTRRSPARPAASQHAAPFGLCLSVRHLVGTLRLTPSLVSKGQLLPLAS